MKEYFISANSFAAPFVSDQSQEYVSAVDARAALQRFVDSYDHPCGLYSAGVYDSHKDFVQRKEPIVSYLSNKAIADTVSNKNPKDGRIL